MDQPIQVRTIDGATVQAIYDVILDCLIAADCDRATAITGLLTVLGTQYHGNILPPEAMQKFVRDASEWFTAYFMDTGATKH